MICQKLLLLHLSLLLLLCSWSLHHTALSVLPYKATGAQLGTLVISLTTVIGGLVYAFVHDWRLTLVVLAFVPFMILAAAMQMKIFTGQGAESGAKGDEAQLESGKVGIGFSTKLIKAVARF